MKRSNHQDFCPATVLTIVVKKAETNNKNNCLTNNKYSKVLDLIYELPWYLFAACLEGIMTLKKYRAKYLLYILKKMISTSTVHVIFQYLLIYFNNMIQDLG